MIETVVKYLLDVAPALAVVVVLFYYQNQRMARLEDTICSMLNECMNEVFEHLNQESKE